MPFYDARFAGYRLREQLFCNGRVVSGKYASDISAAIAMRRSPLVRRGSCGFVLHKRAIY